MPRYAAFLRGVSPMNAKMPELVRAFEQCGFTNVTTVISSGNVVFDARTSSEAAIERKAEAAMTKHLGRTFLTIVRPIDALKKLLATDPYASFELVRGAKRNVTFLRVAPRRRIALPLGHDEARILTRRGRDVFCVYVPGPQAAVFMPLIEKTFGKEVTTRTWETVEKVARR